jgi:hypothetical protein
MPPKVYIETTIPSYLTSKTSRDIVIAAHQQITRDWWQKQRGEFDLYVSEFVVRECKAGDPAMAKLRMEILADMSELALVPDVYILAEKLINVGPIPRKAETDALHIAASAVSGMDFLLTWNCKHIANATMQNRIRMICRDSNFDPPVICTPWELLGDEGNVEG